MKNRMHRRQFIAALGGAAALPLTAHAQQPSDHARRIGVLMPYTRDNPEDQQRVAAFQESLKRSGWIEGRNIQSEGTGVGKGTCRSDAGRNSGRCLAWSGGAAAGDAALFPSYS
jgi:hypothetical protein